MRPLPWTWRVSEFVLGTDEPTQWDLYDARGRTRCTIWRSGSSENQPGLRFTWHTWDENGTGGENAEARSLNDAKDLAIAAIVRQGWAPGGWRVAW